MIEGVLQRGMSRAGLLKLGAAAAAVVVGGRSAVQAVEGSAGHEEASAKVAGRAVRGPRQFKLATYVPLVGSTFKIHRPAARPLPVKLVSATRLPSTGEAFSLIFRGHSNAKLGQLTYRIEHPRLGEFSLFVVPVGPAASGQDFEAIVNRISPAR